MQLIDKIKYYLKSPAHNYTDFYDIARFKLAWKIIVLLTISLFLISVFYLFINKVVFFQYFSGFILVLTGLIYLIVIKRFVTVSYMLIAVSFMLVASSLFFVKNVPHYIELLWLIIITIFSYFMVGKRTGKLILAISMLVYSCYFYCYMESNKTLKDPLDQLDLIGMIFELFLCLVVIGYFIGQFIATTNYAEQKYREANNELQVQNTKISLQNQEKTVLLQEIHHRVKNNLQVITSMLRLQMHKINSEETKHHFNDAINRIMTMSLVHQKMYQNESLSNLDVTEYFSTLINDLIRTSFVSIPVHVRIDSKLSMISSKTMVPLALLIAELISNSFKHANLDENGQISIEFGEVDAGFFNFYYSDNGTWKTPEDSSSFGTQLIQTLTDQLDGSCELVTDNSGTHYSFRLALISDGDIHQ